MSDRESRKKQITEQREEQILKAALEVFTRRGYAAATIPEIAGVAGVAVGTIYTYYSSKRELFIAAVKDLVIADLSLGMKDKKPDADITAIIGQIMQNRLELMGTEFGSRIPYLMSEIARDPELKALWIDQSIQPFFDQMESVYQVMMASGRLRHMDTALAVRVVAGLIIGLNILNFLEGEKSPLTQISQEELAHTLTDFIFHGLAADKGDNEGEY